MKKRPGAIALILSLAVAAALFASCGVRDGGGDPTLININPFTETAPESTEGSAAETEAGSGTEGEPAIPETGETEPAAVSGDFVFKNAEDGTVWLDAYRGVDAVVEIPSVDPVSGKRVAGIDVWAFRDNATVKEVTIPGTVKVIEKNAFMYCSSLETVNMPDELEAIGDQAFYRCSALKRIDVPEGVKKIGYAAFMYCESLEEVVLPTTLEEIGASAFSYCYSLVNIYSRGSDSDWYRVTVADGAMPPTWYTIAYYYGTW